MTANTCIWNSLHSNLTRLVSSVLRPPQTIKKEEKRHMIHMMRLLRLIAAWNKDRAHTKSSRQNIKIVLQIKRLFRVSSMVALLLVFTLIFSFAVLHASVLFCFGEWTTVPRTLKISQFQRRFNYRASVRRKDRWTDERRSKLQRWRNCRCQCVDKQRAWFHAEFIFACLYCLSAS